MNRYGMRRKKWRLPMTVVSLACALTVAVGCSSSGSGGSKGSSSGASEGVLRVGIVADPPFILRTASGEWTSLAPALDRKFAAYLHKKIEFVPTGFTTAIAALQANKFDMFGADFHATPEREKVVNFATPYNMSGTTWWVAKGNKTITKVADLNNPSVSIAEITGSDNEQTSHALIPEAHLVLLPNASLSDLILQLQSGKVDAFAESSYLVPALAKAYPQFQAIPDNTTGEMATGQGWCFNKKDTDLLNEANKFLAEEKASGDLAKLVDQYITVENAAATS